MTATVYCLRVGAGEGGRGAEGREGNREEGMGRIQGGRWDERVGGTGGAEDREGKWKQNEGRWGEKDSGGLEGICTICT